MPILNVQWSKYKDIKHVVINGKRFYMMVLNKEFTYKNWEEDIIFNFILKDFTNKLIKNNYKIVVIFHMSDIKTLQERILKRGENLYAQQGYYRAYNMKKLPSVINNLYINLEEYIKPLQNKGIITDIIYISS
jgi:hypothetical protein